MRLAYDGLRIPFENVMMKIIRSLAEIPSRFGPTVVSVGNFDGGVGWASLDSGASEGARTQLSRAVSGHYL